LKLTIYRQTHTVARPLCDSRASCCPAILLFCHLVVLPSFSLLDIILGVALQVQTAARDNRPAPLQPPLNKIKKCRVGYINSLCGHGSTTSFLNVDHNLRTTTTRLAAKARSPMPWRWKCLLGQRDKQRRAPYESYSCIISRILCWQLPMFNVPMRGESYQPRRPRPPGGSIGHPQREFP